MESKRSFLTALHPLEKNIYWAIWKSKSPKRANVLIWVMLFGSLNCSVTLQSKLRGHVIPPPFFHFVKLLERIYNFFSLNAHSLVSVGGNYFPFFTCNWSLDNPSRTMCFKFSAVHIYLQKHKRYSLMWFKPFLQKHKHHSIMQLKPFS